MHIVDDNIFACKDIKSEKTDIVLTDSEKDKCITFCKKSNLRVAQIILVEEEVTKEKFFINLSKYPNWNLNSQNNIDKIFNSLYNALKMY